MADQEKPSQSRNDKKDQSGSALSGGKDGADRGGGGELKGQVDLQPLPIPRNMETPEGLELRRSGIDDSKLGVWCCKAINEGTTFGPFHGEKVTKTRKDSDPLHVWEIVDLETKEFLFYIDATRTEYGNWTRYAQCARFFEEQNLVAHQEGIDIMYEVIKPIKEGEELLTWYKMPSHKRGQRQVGRASEGRAKTLKELEKSPADTVTKAVANTSPGSSKKKVASPISKVKALSEEKNKGESRKDSEHKSSESDSNVTPKKTKPCESKAASAKSPEPKSSDNKSTKSKPPKVKSPETIQNKGKKQEVKQDGEKSVEAKSSKAKLVESKQPKTKPTDVKSPKGKTSEVKDTDTKPSKTVKTEILKTADKNVTCDQTPESSTRELKDKQKTEPRENKTLVVVEGDSVKSADVKLPKVPSAETLPSKKDKCEKQADKCEKQADKSEKQADKSEKQADKCEKQAEEMSKDNKSCPKKDDKPKTECKVKTEGPVKFQVKGAVTKDEDSIDNLDDDHDGDELEIDLGDESNDLEDEDLGGESDDSKMDCGKGNAVIDPEKYQFELKKDHITKSRYGRKVFKCDICSGVYRHAFSLKRHYIRNHINLKFVSRADILNCQINPDVHDLALGSDKGKLFNKEEMQGEIQASKPDTNEDEMVDSGSPSTMPLVGCDIASKRGSLSIDVPGKNLDGFVVEDLHDTENSDCKSVSFCSDNSTEDEATNGLSKQLTGRMESVLNGEQVKEELFVFSGLYRCNVCNKLYDNVTDLKEHLENHPNQPTSKAFACDKCDMKFSHKQNLMRHLAVHTGEKPFICQFCGKTFPTATNQKRHERIHLGRRISCDYCTSTFTQSGDLKKHIRKLHPECFHECAFCGKYFTDEEELSEHVSSHNESLRSNEEESNRRRDAFKVDMEIDRMESMRLAEQKTPGFKFACTVCKKRFHDYANMCRHRRLAHQRHLLISHGSTSSSPVPSPTKLASDNSDSDPQAFFYANVASNISENLTNYIEGTKDDIAKAACQIKRDFPPQTSDASENPKSETPKSENPKSENPKTKIKQEKKDFVNYNFPGGFSPKENYRKVVENKDEIARILATDLKIVQKQSSSKPSTPKNIAKERGGGRSEEKSDFDLQFVETEKLGDNVTDLRAAELKVIQTLTDLKKMDEVNKAQAALKAVDLKVVDSVINLKVNKDDYESKPMISAAVNGVSLNIPVFNVSNLTKKEVKNQPVCTVQPIQRQSQVTPDTPKSSNALTSSTKCSPPSSSEKPKTTSPKAPFHEKAANMKTVTSSNMKNLPPSIKSSQSSSFSLKIPQVHVCPVCRRLFNNEMVFRQHMLDKHKTSPEENAAAQSAKDNKDSKNVDTSKNKDLSSPGSQENHVQEEPMPAMDLSGKSSETTPVKPSIDHDEGAQLLLEFAMGVREEVTRAKPSKTSDDARVDTSAPLDLSASLPTSAPSGPKKASVFGGGPSKDKPITHKFTATRGHQVYEQAPFAHSSHLLQTAPNAHSHSNKGNVNKPVAAHSGNKIPAAHSGSGSNSKQTAKAAHVPNFQLSPDADIPAPLVTPPSMPKSPWQPQFPLFGPKAHTVNMKKYICTVCYSEFRSRGSLFSHQRASHPNVRCDHVEVDSDVVAPWWQKPSPVGMLNVCSSQVADLNPAEQKHFICTKCNKKFTTTEDLHSHILDCADKVKMKPKPQHHLHHHHHHPTQVQRPVSSQSTAPTTIAVTTAATLTAAVVSPPATPDKPKTVQPHVIHDPVMPKVGKTEDTPASATSSKPEPEPQPQQQMLLHQQQQQQQPQTQTHWPQQQQQQQPQQHGQSKLAKMKSSIMKRLKRKSEVEGTGVVNKKKRRNPELLYNPQNHVRRREMTEVLDMQCCRGCGQHFSTISLLERHIPLCLEKDKLKTLQVSRNPIDSLSDPSEMKNLCRYCHKQFTYTGMLRKHVFEICQVRKTRIQDGVAIEDDWEQEIGQYHSSSASVDTCSNDGSHLDDAASTAASTSSHDTDASNKNKRKKRKNRGWGNSKKKRSLSDGVDINADDNWGPDCDPEVTGSEAAGKDDYDDDDFDGSVSDSEPMEKPEKSPEKKPEVEIKADDECKVPIAATGSDVAKEKPTSSSVPMFKDIRSEPIPTKFTASEISKIIKESIPHRLGNVISELPGPSKIGLTLEKNMNPPLKFAKECEPKKANKSRVACESSSTCATPFVLSVPQYTERVPPVKTKTTKSPPGDKHCSPVDVNKKKKTLNQNPSKKLKLTEASASRPTGLVSIESKSPPNRKIKENPVPKDLSKSTERPKASSPKFLLIDSKPVKEELLSDHSMCSVAKEVPVKILPRDKISPEPTAEPQNILTKIKDEIIEKLPLAAALTASTSNDSKPCIKASTPTPPSLVEKHESKTPEVVTQATSSTEIIRIKASSLLQLKEVVSPPVVPINDSNGEIAKEDVGEIPMVEPLVINSDPPKSTPAEMLSHGHSSEKILESVPFPGDKLVSPVKEDISEVKKKGGNIPPESEESDESSDEEDIKEYINTFLAARRNKVNSKRAKCKTASGDSPKSQPSKDKDQKPFLSSKTSKDDQPSISPKKDKQTKKVSSPSKKLKAGGKQADHVKTKVVKKAMGTLKNLKNKKQVGILEKKKNALSPGLTKKKVNKVKMATAGGPQVGNSEKSMDVPGEVINKGENGAKIDVTVTDALDLSVPTGEKAVKSPKPPKAKKKAVEGAKNKCGNKEKTKSASDESKESPGGKSKKTKHIVDQSKSETKSSLLDMNDARSTMAAEVSTSPPKKEKAVKTGAKAPKTESPKKGSAGAKTDRSETDTDTSVNRSRKRKAGDPNVETTPKSKSTTKSPGPPSAKIVRTRGLTPKGKDSETQEKDPTNPNVKGNQTRRGTRSHPSQAKALEENKPDQEASQKAKAKKTVKKESPVKIKRSVSVVTRQINDDKTVKVREPNKPMRTRQSRHSL